MKIGVPKEVKPNEGRVALIPAACEQLVKLGHEVRIQMGAGVASGYKDAAYLEAGGRLVPSAAAVYGDSQLMVKVKEPVEAEWGLLRQDHLLFSFLHLAAAPQLAETLCRIGLTSIALETVRVGSSLPILAPMSQIAGRIAVQVGAHLLHSSQGGRGVLLGGVAGAQRGEVVVLGAGSAGMSATQLAAAMGAQVTVFDVDLQRLEMAREVSPNVTGLYSYPKLVAEKVKHADLLIGAVLLPGIKAPKVVSRDVVKTMVPGSVIVDVSVDQGGCVETTEPRTYESPTYVAEGVIHFTVTNMPGAVARTASQVLSAAITPYLIRLADGSWSNDPVLQGAINTQVGKNLLASKWGR